MNRDKVLIIEDSRVFRDLIKASIAMVHPFECVCAHSLKEAEDILKAQGDEFFCATIDINLPDCQDASAVELIVDEYPGISPIVFTGEFDKGLREDIIALNVADYVTKSSKENINYVANLIFKIYNNHSIKVLVVDDSASARKQMQMMLRTHKYQVVEAKSGDVALEKLKEHPDVCLALVDCFMDGMNGFELTQKIRSTHSKENCIIIGVSSNDSKQISAEFIKSGANDFLVKPFSLEEFHCRVSQNIELLTIVRKYQIANEVKNKALGTAAHDLRGPVGIIGTIASLILRRTFDAKKEEYYLETIVENTENLMALLESLLDVSVIEDGTVDLNITKIELDKILTERVNFYHHLAIRKSITLNFKCPGSVTVDSDKLKIIQVIDNLLSNAIKYAPENSTVITKLTSDDIWTYVEVFDEGLGVAPEDQEKLFSAYQTCNNKPSGGETSTGLGLAICQNIIKAHGGKIGYKDNLPKGSCFYFMLPKRDI